MDVMKIRQAAMDERNKVNKQKNKKTINHLHEDKKKPIIKKNNMDYEDFNKFIEVIKNAPKPKKINHMLDFINHEADIINESIK